MVGGGLLLDGSGARWYWKWLVVMIGGGDCWMVVVCGGIGSGWW